MGKGVFQKKNGTFVQFTTREGLTDNLVPSIYRDNQGNLWFSTFAGVSVRHNDGTIKSFTSRDGLSGKVVNNIYEDKSQNIWIAADQGVTFLEKGKITKPNIKYYLNGIPTVSIYKDPSTAKGEGPVFWISTDGAGLKRLRLKDGMIQSYTVEQGMVTNSIYQFFEDRGNFWLTSSSGLLRVSKKELNLLAKGEISMINCTSFGKAEGMQSTEFHNELSRHSALQTRDGELWFVTKKGISILNPGKIYVNKIQPPVVIESIFFDQQSISPQQDANAKPFKGITNFNFHFTALSFLSPEKIKFQYRLEGFDKEWKYLPPGSKRVVHYQNLEPGTYTFKVIACNADGICNQTGDSITFTLNPFFYQTLVFKIIILLILAALLAASVYIYKKLPFGKKKKPRVSSLAPHFAEDCIKKLNHLVEVEKVFRDEKISIRSLAEKLSIPHYQLSLVLNEKLNHTFTDYINYYRIEEAKSILASDRTEEMNVSTVAHKVGFNNMTTFYKAFKKFTGMTPKQYKKEIKKKKI
jgi:AraC-like DNA-binding protein